MISPSSTVALLIALVAIGLCSADPQCKPDLNEEDCSACCAKNSDSRNEATNDSCECHVPANHKSKVEGDCSGADHYITCQSCCYDSKFANGYWDYFNSTCTCLAKKQYIPNDEGLCSYSQHHDECMDCCTDMNYADYRWDDWKGCACKDKNRDGTSTVASRPKSRDFEACLIGCSIFGYTDFRWSLAHNLCNCFNMKDLSQQNEQLQKEIAGECSDTTNHDDCMDCCKESDYSHFGWSDHQGCHCTVKILDVPDIKSVCRVAYDSENCEKCCRGTNFADFLWKSDWNICYCKDYHLPRPKPTQRQIQQQQQALQVLDNVCPEVEHYEGCMQCCRDLSYVTSRWDSEKHLCQCSDKQDHKLEPWIIFTKVLENRPPSIDG